MAKLKYASFLSEIELPFYTSLASHKINHDKLDDSARRVLGLYQLQPRENPETSCRLSLHGNALTGDEVPAGFYRAEGVIRNMNTIEDYRALDKAAVLNRAAKTIWDAINDGTIYSIPSLLASFTVLCFADLKKYKFTYLFGFPALNLETSWNLLNHEDLEAGRPASVQEHNQSFLTADESTALVDAVQTWRYGADTRQFGFFLAKKAKSSTAGEEGEGLGEEPISPGLERKPSYSWVIGSISRFDQGFFRGIPPQDRYICFSDPSTYKSNPGWMLRNFLVLVRKKWNMKKLQALCFRDEQSRRHEARSIILQLEAEEPAQAQAAESTELASTMPKVVGWEKNHQNKVVSKVANLGEYMDPSRLADQAVDLNLKLIKWRIAPTIDLDIVKNTKCLLLGAGTLGSYVSRNLLGWGVRKVTFIDNGTVSFSNPVRQPLFDFKDCLSGGAKKAHRAAEALKEIYPGVDSNGHELLVPMAGHAMVDEAKTKADFEKLKSLIEEHDVIYLLMDTRESRWLPTVMAKAAGKLVMNAALGFDTFVVMRHGVKDSAKPGAEPGCYFCNDVVAPADSMSDRTLDQQCTVTRPGGAAIASALLVEIMVSVLQHKDGAMAPGAVPGAEQNDDHPLGIVPHQIRGFLSSFQNMVINGKSYDCCSACSDKVTGAYSEQGWEFVKKALTEKGYVEELSGLAEIQRAAEKAAQDIEWDESEDEIPDEREGEML